jgi:hypothetical protein
MNPHGGQNVNIVAVEQNVNLVAEEKSRTVSRRPVVADNLPDAPGRKPDVRVSITKFASSLPEFEKPVDFELKVIERTEIKSVMDIKEDPFVPLLEICKLESPVLKMIPKPAASLFAKTWSSLLLRAVASKRESHWSDFFLFPRVVLLAPKRGGRRISRRETLAEMVLQRMTVEQRKVGTVE